MSFTGFTVIDRIKSLGIQTENRFCWAVGDAVRDEWERQEGGAPEKALRPKTNGAGSHCLAVYPNGFRPVADALIRRIALEYQAAAASQMSLFEMLYDSEATH